MYTLIHIPGTVGRKKIKNDGGEPSIILMNQMVEDVPCQKQPSIFPK